MKSTHLTITLFIFTCILSCKKDESTSSFIPGITYGDVSAMKVHAYGTTLHNEESVALDLDDTSGNDIEIVFLHFSDPNNSGISIDMRDIGHNYTLSFVAELNVERYQHLNNTKVYTQYNEKRQTHIVKEQQFIITCNRIASSDYWVYNPFTVLNKTSVDKLDTSNTFVRVGYASILSSKISTRDDGNTVYGDTLIINKLTYEDNCKQRIFFGKERYLGFRMETGGRIRLGWIKLNVIGLNTVVILETAISK
jgi:hypothetical protein